MIVGIGLVGVGSELVGVGVGIELVVAGVGNGFVVEVGSGFAVGAYVDNGSVEVVGFGYAVADDHFGNVEDLHVVGPTWQMPSK